MVWLSLEFVLLGLASLASVINAHPGEADEFIHPGDVSRRQLEATGRHIRARDCGPQIAAHLAARKARRALTAKPDMRRRGPDSVPQGTALWRRGHGHRHKPPPHHGTTSVLATTGAATSSSTAEGPKYTSIQNSTCVTAPEVTEGPYYVNNELVRSDIREDQRGVDLLLDIGVIDTTTCQPLDQAFVEIWSCNATGSYAGFTQASLGPPPNITRTLPAATESASASATATTSRGPPGAPGGPGGPGSPGMSDQNTFLRGGVPTNENGVLEFKTIYPGFYTGRTVHIHAMVQTNYTIFPNGTIGSKLGDLHHIGQIFFDDSLNDQVVSLPTYSNTNHTRTRNAQDGILQGANTDGYNSFAQAELLGDSIEDGVLAYITIGVDTTRHVNISSSNYASTITWGSSPTGAANLL